MAGQVDAFCLVPFPRPCVLLKLQQAHQVALAFPAATRDLAALSHPTCRNGSSFSNPQLESGHIHVLNKLRSESGALCGSKQWLSE